MGFQVALNGTLLVIGDGEIVAKAASGKDELHACAFWRCYLKKWRWFISVSSTKVSWSYFGSWVDLCGALQNSAFELVHEKIG